MNKKLSVVVLILILATAASADEYLKSTCQSILKNDLVNTIKIVDLKKDGTPHIMFGTSTNGILYNYIYKGADCTVDWTAMGSGGWTFDTDGDLRSFIITDLIGDGKTEIVMNTAKPTAAGAKPPNQYLKAVSINAIDYWNFRDDCGFAQAVDAADLDKTGKPNVVFGTQNNMVCALKDSADGHLPKDAVLWKYVAKFPVSYVKAMDIDGDGAIETVALASKYMDAYMNALDKDGKPKWEKRIEGGIFQGVLPQNVMDVADIDGDGKAEAIVGTYKNGVTVIDSSGNDRWSYSTKNLVSSILVADINNDGKKEVLVGSAPNVVALDSTGKPMWTWNAPTSSTIYSMYAADIDGSGKDAIAVGSTKYLYVLGNDGKLKGTWKYQVEIQGLTKAFEERDANAVAVYMGDLDGDGQTEIAAGWNWEQSTVRGNQYSADIRVYKINKDYVPSAADTTATTVPPQTGGADEEQTDTTLSDSGTDNAGAEETQEADDGTAGTDETSAEETSANKTGACGCLPMLPAILALGLAIAAKVPFAATKD